ncbi:MAG: hypothetical protein ACTSRP_01845 [Candidatus Helarchaeota archaeon]
MKIRREEALITVLLEELENMKKAIMELNQLFKDKKHQEVEEKFIEIVRKIGELIVIMQDLSIKIYQK